MKRWTFRIVLCLLLGVVTTVGVAWGFAVVAREPPKVGSAEDRYGLLDDGSSQGWVELRAAFGRQSRALLFEAPVNESDAWVTGLPKLRLPEWSVLRSPLRREVDIYGFTRLYDRVYGWPRLCIRYELLCSTRAVSTPLQFQIQRVRFGVPLARDESLPLYVSSDFFRILPLRPILPGFLIDTLPSPEVRDHSPAWQVHSPARQVRPPALRFQAGILHVGSAKLQSPRTILMRQPPDRHVDRSILHVPRTTRPVPGAIRAAPEVNLTVG